MPSREVMSLGLQRCDARLLHSRKPKIKISREGTSIKAWEAITYYSRARNVFDANHARLTTGVQECQRNDKQKCGDLPPVSSLFIATVN
jgi:hypothetical protein